MTPQPAPRPAAAEGSCDLRFAPVREVFSSNFTERGEPCWQNPRNRALINAVFTCL